MHSFTISFIILVQAFQCISAQLIPFGTKGTFNFENEILISDLRDSVYRSGYRLRSKLTISSIWNSDDKEQQLLQLELEPPRLEIKTGNARQGEKYYAKSSNLDNMPPITFYIFSNGLAEKLLTTRDKDVWMLNLKRGIASVLLFTSNEKEEDISGECNVKYRAKSSTKYEKVKTNCSNWIRKTHHRQDKPLGIDTVSSHVISYEFTQDAHLNKLKSLQVHQNYVEAKPDVGNKISSTLVLDHVSNEEVVQLPGKLIDDVLNNLEGVERINLAADIDPSIGTVKEKLKSEIRLLKDAMVDENVGTSNLSSITVKLVPLVRAAKKEELVQILKAQSIQDIRYQILDLLAGAQTLDAHLAVMEVFPFNNEDNFYYVETYLQSLSVGSRTNLKIIQDIHKRLKDTNSLNANARLKDTLLQTLSALLAKHAKLSSNGYSNNDARDLKEFYIKELDKCKENDDDCREIFIRGFQNLKHPDTVSLLLNLVLKGSKQNAVAAMKALREYPIKYFTPENRKSFEKIFFERIKRFDSTIRTIALDILLNSKPNIDELKRLLKHLISHDNSIEVKTYLIEKIRLISSQCPKFAALVKEILKTHPELNNYKIESEKGLTTAMERTLSNSPGFNESLLSIQEISNGVLKYGVVDLTLQAKRETISTFKIGLFTSGLASFVGGSEKSEDREKEETEIPKAGMEISVQGVQFRPIIFFTGNSELMGHVWSGTASEPTAAYQGTTLLHDHEEYVLLQCGAVVYTRILSAESVDLNGQIQLSIWNRNAHVEINRNSGFSLKGISTLKTSFIKLENHFTLEGEPKINLFADVDFYSDVALCLQLSRPEINLQQVIRKNLEILGKNYSTKTHVSIKHKLMGKSLALNQKNNEMCNKIFSSEE